DDHCTAAAADDPAAEVAAAADQVGIVDDGVDDGAAGRRARAAAAGGWREGGEGARQFAQGNAPHRDAATVDTRRLPVDGEVAGLDDDPRDAPLDLVVRVDVAVVVDSQVPGRCQEAGVLAGTVVVERGRRAAAADQI